METPFWTRKRRARLAAIEPLAKGKIISLPFLETVLPASRMLGVSPSSELDVFDENQAPVLCLLKRIVCVLGLARGIHEVFLIFGDRQTVARGGGSECQQRHGSFPKRR